MSLTDILRIRDLMPGMSLWAACGCNQGKKRNNNEDNFYFDGTYMNSDNHGLLDIYTKRLSIQNDSFFCVFDGMGGGDFGEVASYTAAKAAKDFLDVEKNINPCDITPSLEYMCQMINQAVFHVSENMGSTRMGSTLAGLYFHEGQVWVCNLGDSRCFSFRNGRMQLISQDHTDEEFMKENGITGRKPYLTQYLGIDPDEMTIVPSICSNYLKKGDRFLICSDGVTDMVEGQEICDLLSRYADPAECVEILIQAALDGGGKDNITAIVLYVE